MLPPALADAAPPFAAAPRWRLPLFLLVALVLLLSSLAVSTVRYTHVWEDPYSVATNHFSFFDDSRVANALGMIIAHLYILVPVILLHALFCARLGVERGRALETGILPGLVLFGGLMFASGFVQHLPLTRLTLARSVGIASFEREVVPGFFTHHEHVPASPLGWMLLACFAALRAAPPAPARVGLGWTLAAGAFGMWSLCGEADALGGIVALSLYVGWSAGRRRTLGFVLVALAAFGAVATFVERPYQWWMFSGELFYYFLGWHVLLVRYLVLLGALALLSGVFGRRMPPAVMEMPMLTPTPDALTAAASPAVLPFAPAHRIIGLLLFLALMETPIFLIGGTMAGSDFMLLPLSVAASLLLTIWLERASHVARAIADVGALAILLYAVLTCVYTYYAVIS